MEDFPCSKYAEPTYSSIYIPIKKKKRIWQGAKERKCNKMLVALGAKVPG